MYVNHAGKSITFKIVYYGAGMSGKTTNVQVLHTRTHKKKGELISLATETKRTVFYDFLPMTLGTLKGYRLDLQLYTVPGQIFYDEPRRLILKGVDGVVFVVDSQLRRLEANLEAFNNLGFNLKRENILIDEIPIVFQYNKRDTNDIFTIEKLQELYNQQRKPFFKAQANHGIGVFQTFQEIGKRVLMSSK